jgi:UDP-N-acetylmuramate dehydrogenase
VSGRAPGREGRIHPDARHALEDALGEDVQFDVPMSRHTSLRIGGPADALASPGDREALSKLLAACAAHELPLVPIGAGFNTLVGDAGIDGVVVKLNRFRSLERRPNDRVFAEAGVTHATLTRFCVEHGLAGLEFGAGIPGVMGGWIAMNAGIGTREVVDVVHGIEVIGPGPRPPRCLPRAALDFGYRALRGLAPGTLTVSVLFDVTPSERAAVRAEVDRLLARRAETQPTNVPSCGSVFKNPEGDYAGRLIEAAGLKGATEGGAQISPVHANFIANTGGATAADVLRLMERTQKQVESETGIRLEPEVKIVGVQP